MTERRYSRDEVDAIFASAAKSPPASSTAPDAPTTGFTLVELQEIGREVGIGPDAVARAAHALDRPRLTATRTLLGQPIAVAHTAALGRTLSDGDWERLVVDLRQTFNASGRVRVDGGLRQWSNGNLKVMLEPAADGQQQLRMQTMNGNARTFMLSGAAAIGLSVIVAASSALSGTLSAAVSGIAVLAAVGGTMFATGAVRLPAWSQRRREQMDQVARRLTGGDTGK